MEKEQEKEENLDNNTNSSDVETNINKTEDQPDVK